VARLGQFALREREPQILFEHVLGAVAATLELEFCAVLELRAGSQSLDIVASNGFREAAVRDREVPKQRKLPGRPRPQPGRSGRRRRPQVVADRLVRVGKLIGRDRLMAGTDCGFDTFVKFSQVDPAVAWHKLGAMVQGAELATAELS
jgi:hypothetical protein